ncbi:MAG: hypothetical protein K9W43_06230 [Candidatus Thorarchaeota archaeon]|nr:hypothetical protein [Candidatus Thorarchaeota archaeon]
MAILGYRLDSYGLVSMRVHDINVVADLNRHDPNAPSQDEPVEYDNDGTPVGAAKSVRTGVPGYSPSSIEAQVQNAITVRWLAPWPVVEFSTDIHIQDYTATISFTVNL